MARLRRRARAAPRRAISRPSTVATSDADDRREREADAGVLGEVADDEAGDAREGELDDRDLADEAGDDDEREAVSTAAISELISAWRKSKGKTISADAADEARRAAAGRSSRSGRGTIGSPCSTSSPRRGRLAPRRKSAITIRTKTSSCCTPGQRRRRGRSGTSSASRRSRGCSGPCRSRGRQRRRSPIEVKVAKSAAASAGTTWSGQRCAGRAEVTGAASTPSVPSNEARRAAVLAIERRLGESPASMPETSFSEAARVARPKRVQR